MQSYRPRISEIPLAVVGNEPRQNGLTEAKLLTDGQEDPYTGAPNNRATLAIDSSTPDSAISLPATITVRPGLNCNSSAAKSGIPEPTLARSMRLAGSVGGEPASSRIFIGRERKTGPRGGDIELWKARRRINGRSSSEFGSKHHLAIGAAIPTRSAASRGSAKKWRRSCCPAVTIIGTLAILAFIIAPIPCPRPPAVCRLTKAGLPDA